MVKIKSDGTSQNTKVFIGETELGNITELEIEPIRPGNILQAIINVHLPELDLEIKESRVTVINHANTVTTTVSDVRHATVRDTSYAKCDRCDNIWIGLTDNFCSNCGAKVIQV